MGMLDAISNLFSSKESTSKESNSNESSSGQEPAEEERSEEAPVVEEEQTAREERPRKRRTRGKSKGKGKGKRKGKRSYTKKGKAAAAASVRPGKVAHANDATFDRLANVEGTPVLVDFWAEWCGPCKMIAPVLDEVAAEMGEEARILKVNVDDSQRVAQRFSIRNIPTLLLMQDGEVVDVMVGVQSKSKMLKVLRKLAKKKAA